MKFLFKKTFIALHDLYLSKFLVLKMSDKVIGPALPPMFRAEKSDEDSDNERGCKSEIICLHETSTQ